ncbi:uracil-DNA glycosylase family protein [Solimonas marina]|uniref:Uracil-DNA glycosylase n=1 Tax=Solimonas marina TaxID=2714601 RepID=A0A969WAT2_9GAMM|nr:uracil-DNA glycosylase family protein [Solimonas marina]NKF22081.1 uracil-DNA glycosylase [Solimonas marina]
MSDYQSLLTDDQRRAFRKLAEQTPGIDTEVYARFERDPLEPIVAHGDARARVGFFGRDPGRDEVQHLEPFIGAGGQLVRRALYQHRHGKPLPDFEASRAIGREYFWANTVPYKPVGNKAWSTSIKKRFQPLMAQVLADDWHGSEMIVLGREAFFWFGLNRSKAEREALDAFWERDDRYETSMPVTVGGAARERQITLHPLPHPSPLNATWYARFPALLAARLQALQA